MRAPAPLSVDGPAKTLSSHHVFTASPHSACINRSLSRSLALSLSRSLASPLAAQGPGSPRPLPDRPAAVATGQAHAAPQPLPPPGCPRLPCLIGDACHPQPTRLSLSSALYLYLYPNTQTPLLPLVVSLATPCSCSPFPVPAPVPPCLYQSHPRPRLTPVAGPGRASGLADQASVPRIPA